MCDITTISNTNNTKTANMPTNLSSDFFVFSPTHLPVHYQYSKHCNIVIYDELSAYNERL